MAYFGNAALTWSATSDTNTKRVHLLQQPLRELRPGANLLTFMGESLDRSKVDFFSVGGGAYELVGEVRYDLAPHSLLDLIRAGASGVTLTYYPNLADAGTKYACILMSPRTPSDLTLDHQRGTPFGEQMVTLRLRLTNQAAFQPLVRGNDALFSYRAGESLVGATFTRVTSTAAPATYPDLGYGTLTTAKTGQARIGWVTRPSSLGPRTIPALILEPARTQAIKDAENFGTANWTINGGLTRSSGQPDPRGTNKAWRLVASTLAGSFLSQQQTVPTSGQQAVSCWLGPSSNPSSGHIMAVTSSGGKRLDLKVSWSSGIPTVTVVAGKQFKAPELWQNNLYRFMGLTASSQAFAAGKKVTLRLFPTSTAASASKGTLSVSGAQIE